MHKLYLLQVLRGFARGVLVVATSIVALLIVICALIVVQGRDDDTQRFETGHVGAALVIGPAQPDGDTAAMQRGRLDHAIDLFRHGVVSRIIISGVSGPGNARATTISGKQYLVERGMPAEALLLEDQGATLWESLQHVVPLAQTNRIGAVLIVSEPTHMLRALKMAHDLDLAAYSSPIPTSTTSRTTAAEARAVVDEAWAYLVYLFARQ